MAVWVLLTRVFMLNQLPSLLLLKVVKFFRLKLEVIYNDTDSIMINTNSDELLQVKQIGGTL